MDILEKLLKPSERMPISGLPQWEERHRRVVSEVTSPIEQAFLAGMQADRLGYAFASGLQVAQGVVFGSTQGLLGAVAITEEQGGFPADIECEIRDGRLFGKKTFVTLGPSARVLWVLAYEGTLPNGHKRLRMVKLRLPHDDVEVRRTKSTEFIPEIPNAEVFFEGTDIVDEVVLPKEPWTNYVKPFGVAEDLYVHAAFVGFYSQVMARAEAPTAAQEELLMYATALKSLAQLPLSAPTTQLALEGVLTRLQTFVETPGTFWEEVDAVTQEFWRRDKPVFSMASRTRNRRRESAWKQLHITGTVRSP